MKAKSILFFAFILLPAIVFASWPMFHGDPQSSGLANVKGPSDPVVKWRFKGSGIYMFQSPVIGDDGTVYIVGSVRAAGGDVATHTVYAVNPDGNEKWKYINQERLFTQLALAADGNLYSVTRFTNELLSYTDKRKRQGSYLICISSSTGGLIWEREISDGTAEYWVPHVIVGQSGRVYAQAYDALVVFKPDGAKIWSYKFLFDPNVKAGNSVGPVLSPDEKTVYLMKREGGGGLYAFDAETGKLKWHDKTEYYSNFPQPTVGPDGVIYIANAKDAVVYAITPGGKYKWKSHFPEGRLGDTTPTVGKDGVIYIDIQPKEKLGGTIYALNVADGKIKWNFKFPDGYYMNSPMAVDMDGNVYYGFGNGFVYSLNDKGKLRWGTPLGKKNTIPNEETSSQIYYSGMSLVNGGFYIVVGHADRTGELVAVGEK